MVYKQLGIQVFIFHLERAKEGRETKHHKHSKVTAQSKEDHQQLNEPQVIWNILKQLRIAL